MKIKVRTLQYLPLFIYLCSLSAFQRDTAFESALEIISFAFFVGMTLLQCLSSGRRKIKIDGMTIWYGTFLAFSVLSTLWAIYSKAEVFHYIKKMIQIVAVSECISLTVRNKKDIESIFKVILASLVFAGVLLLSRISLSEWGTRRAGLEIGLDENVLGARMAIGLIISLYFFSQKRGKIYGFLMAFLVLLTVLSGSKNSILMATAGVSLLILYNRKTKNVLRFITRGLFIVIFLGVMIYAVFKVPMFYNVLGIRLERTISFFLSDMRTFDYSTSQRLYYISIAMELFKQHPILGVGLNNFRAYVFSINSQGAYSHSNYWELLSCLGIVGTALFYSFHLHLLHKLISLPKSERSMMTVLSLILLLLFAIFDYTTITYQEVFHYFVICLIYNYARLAKQESAKQGAYCQGNDEQISKAVC